jgi:hypothetical protein
VVWLEEVTADRWGWNEKRIRRYAQHGDSIPPDLPECVRSHAQLGVAQAIYKRSLFTKNASSISETQT